MKKNYLLISLLAFITITAADERKQPAPSENLITAKTETGLATYLGNEALMVAFGKTKVLFDPFFHNNYNTYQFVPTKIRHSLFEGEAPYNDIDAIFISHAHGDHFSAEDLFKFLHLFPSTKLIAPQQALDKLAELDEKNHLGNQLISIKLAYKDAPVTRNLNDISFDAVRIPHAGWPQRADVANLVYRVTLNGQITVMHMGDADPNDEHFESLADHWQRINTDVAYPPYWFFTSQSGPMILENRIQARENVGLHVPRDVPEDLLKSGANFFSKPGETQELKP